MTMITRRFRTTHSTLMQGAIAAALLLSALVSSAAPAARGPAGPVALRALPAPIAEMLRQGEGVRFQDRFDAPGGLTGYVLSAKNGERRIYYVTPDGAHAILGLMFNARLENETAAHQQTYMSVAEFIDAPGASRVASAAPTAFDAALAARGGMVEGKGWDLFVVFDPLSPLSRSLHKRLRSELGKLRVHWQPVAIDDERSLAVIQAWLRTSEADRPRALASMMGRSFDVGRVPPLAAGAPLDAATQQAVAGSVSILKAAGLQSAPALVYRDATGAVRLSVIKRESDVHSSVLGAARAAAQAVPR